MSLIERVSEVEASVFVLPVSEMSRRGVRSPVQPSSVRRQAAERNEVSEWQSIGDAAQSVLNRIRPGK